MKRFWLGKVIKMVVFAALAVVVVGIVVMSLLNWLAPTLFGWPTLSFVQALGLFVLAKLLFGSLRGFHGRGDRWRSRLLERYEQMTPDERTRFREGLRRHCGQAPAHVDEGARPTEARV